MSRDLEVHHSHVVYHVPLRREVFLAVRALVSRSPLLEVHQFPVLEVRHSHVSLHGTLFREVIRTVRALVSRPPFLEVHHPHVLAQALLVVVGLPAELAGVAAGQAQVDDLKVPLQAPRLGEAFSTGFAKVPPQAKVDAFHVEFQADVD